MVLRFKYLFKIGALKEWVFWKYDVRNKIMSGHIKTERSSSILYEKGWYKD